MIWRVQGERGPRRRLHNRISGPLWWAVGSVFGSLEWERLWEKDMHVRALESPGHAEAGRWRCGSLVRCWALRTSGRWKGP